MSIRFFRDDARKLLIYEVDDPRIAQFIKGTINLGKFVAVPQSLYNTQVLAWLGYPVAPVMKDYEWPHNARALPPDAKACPTYAQTIMANFCVANPRAFNLSDMGTMKTLAALWSADYVMNQYPKGECKALIIAKLSTLQRVWGNEIFNHFMGRRTYQILHCHSAKARINALNKDADFYILNPDGLKVGAKFGRKRSDLRLGGFVQELFKRTDIKITIIDEASSYRHANRKRHRIATLFTLPERMPYVWLLTGSPTPNAPTDAYGLAKIINDAHGLSFSDFEAQTMLQLPNSFKKVPQRGSYERAAKLLTPAVRFNIKDIWDGPPCTKQLCDVELTPTQRELLLKLKRECALVMRGQKVTPANEAAMRTKALQIAQGEIYDDKHGSHPTDANTRIKETIELIQEATKKTLIFAPFTNVINMLTTQLTASDIGCIKINGEVKGKARDNALANFLNDPLVRVAVCDPETVAHGINDFVAATTAIWYGPTDKTDNYMQGNKRIHRPGQMFPVTIQQMAATALEREIYRRLDNNESMQGVLLNWIEGEGL